MELTDNIILWQVFDNSFFSFRSEEENQTYPKALKTQSQQSSSFLLLRFYRDFGELGKVSIPRGLTNEGAAFCLLSPD